MSILTDVHISGTSIQITGGDSTSYQHMQLNYVSGHMAARMNVLHISENSSISLHIKPKIGVGVSYEVFDGGSWYNVGGSFPLFIECNFGLASRSKSLKNNGFVFGGGIEYFIWPLFAYPLTEVPITLEEYKKSWVTYVFESGFRYLNEKNIAKEINFTVGIGEDAKDFITFEGNLEKEKRPISFRLSFSRLINY